MNLVNHDELVEGYLVLSGLKKLNFIIIFPNFKFLVIFWFFNLMCGFDCCTGFSSIMFHITIDFQSYVWLLIVAGTEVKPGKPFTHIFDGLKGRLHISVVMHLI